ncbi:hypothetical protein BV898_19166, partial [Hypsibius exemplaris]
IPVATVASAPGYTGYTNATLAYPFYIGYTCGYNWATPANTVLHGAYIG